MQVREAVADGVRSSCNAAFFLSPFDLSSRFGGMAGAVGGLCGVAKAGELYDFRGQ